MKALQYIYMNYECTALAKCLPELFHSRLHNVELRLQRRDLFFLSFQFSASQLHISSRAGLQAERLGEWSHGDSPYPSGSIGDSDAGQ